MGLAFSCAPLKTKADYLLKDMTVARITCQTSRKGFSLRMKEDAHWSDAVYQRLDE